MIAVDTSAQMAIVLDEPGAAACRARLEAEVHVVMSAATLVEALIVSAQRDVHDEIERMVKGLGIDVVPVTALSARRAASAHRRWGRGAGTAGLNVGDCFAYEIAASNGGPLLFVGEDLGKIDVRRAL